MKTYVDNVFDDVEPEIGLDGHLAILAATGSRAYGTHNENSDYDFKGVYVASNRLMFSMQGARRTVDLKNPHDIVVYELEHFVKLAAAANPTVLEILWSDEYLQNGQGFLLRQHRHLFLSKRIVHTYGGYALAQAKKAREGTGGSRGANHHKRDKFWKHTLRLVMAGSHALRTGQVLVRLTEGEVRELEGFVRLPDDLKEDVLKVFLDAMDEAAKETELPDQPDVEAIDDLVYQIRTPIAAR